MKRLMVYLLLVAVYAGRTAAGPEDADAFLLNPFLGRGINLGNALEAPREGTWGVTLKEHYFREIAEAGFDSVRIPVRWSEYAGEKPPYEISQKFFDRVDWAVGQALDRGLRVVLNMHHYNKLFEDPAGHSERFIALWRQIAEHYRNRPGDLYFELLNEPHGKLGAVEWNRLLARTLGEVRRTNPERWVVIGPAGYNAIRRLDKLELPEDDRRIVLTVHYYLPFKFTHQGANWAGPSVRNLANVRWMGTDAEKDAIRDDLDHALAWAVKHRRPVYLGEFGAYSKGPFEDRVRWTAFVAQEAVKRKMGFAYWEFCAGFGAYDPKLEEWRAPLKEALLGQK